MLKKMMQGIDSKQKSALLKSVFSMAAVFLVLVMGIYVATSDTLGWFAFNRKVDADDMVITPQGLSVEATYSLKRGDNGEYRDITSWDAILEGLFPGDRVTLRAVYRNTMKGDYTANLVFALPDGGEVPLEEDSDRDGVSDLFYYFGSQIRLNSYAVNGGDAVAHGRCLVENPSSLVSFDAELSSVSDLMICQGLAFGAGETLTVEIELEFVNLPEVDQNAYQNFGGEGSSGVCKRILVAYLDAVS